MSRVLWLVRHAERRDEVDRAWAERADRPHDPPLTDRGRRQAERAGDRLRDCGIEAIYVSPFLGTVETAHLIADRIARPVFVDHGLSQHLDPDWFDVAPSVLSPRVLADRFDTVDPTHSSVLRPNYPESSEEAADRTVRAVRRLAGDATSTLLVGHRLTITSVVAAFTGQRDVETPTCGIARLTAYPWGWDVDLVGDTSHLADGDENGDPTADDG